MKYEEALNKKELIGESITINNKNYDVFISPTNEDGFEELCNIYRSGKYILNNTALNCINNGKFFVVGFLGKSSPIEFIEL